MSEYMSGTSVVLNWEEVASAQSVSRLVLQNAQIDRLEDHIMDGVRYSLRGFILAGAPIDVTARVSVIDPSTHWQRFVWFMSVGAWSRPGKWLESRVDRWLPRRTESHTQTVNRNICPHGVIAKEPHRSHLEWLSQPPIDWKVEA